MEAEIKFSIACPWQHEHTKSPETGSYAGRYPGGGVFFHCYHAHCHHRRWPEFRRAVELRSALGSVEVNISYGG